MSEKKVFVGMSREELVRQCSALKANYVRIRNKHLAAVCQLRNYRSRLRRFRDQMDKLLKHPYGSVDGLSGRGVKK